MNTSVRLKGLEHLQDEVHSSVRLQRVVNEVTFTFFFILYILENTEGCTIPLSAIRLQRTMPTNFLDYLVKLYIVNILSIFCMDKNEVGPSKKQRTKTKMADLKRDFGRRGLWFCHLHNPFGCCIRCCNQGWFLFQNVCCCLAGCIDTLSALLLPCKTMPVLCVCHICKFLIFTRAVWYQRGPECDKNLYLYLILVFVFCANHFVFVIECLGFTQAHSTYVKFWNKSEEVCPRYNHFLFTWPVIIIRPHTTIVPRWKLKLGTISFTFMGQDVAHQNNMMNEESLNKRLFTTICICWPMSPYELN